MLKYLLAAVAAIATLFLSVTVVVLATNKVPGLPGNIFVALATIGATRAVYTFFRKAERKQELTNAPVPALHNDDRIKFEKVFDEIDCAAAGITEIKVAVRTDGFSGFLVGIRSANFSDIEFPLLTEELNKVFYARPRIDFLNLNEEESQWRLTKGTNIKFS